MARFPLTINLAQTGLMEFNNNTLLSMIPTLLKYQPINYSYLNSLSAPAFFLFYPYCISSPTILGVLKVFLRFNPYNQAEY